MKRLLVICHGFPPYYGGAEHVAYYLAREAAHDGCEVQVLTSDIGGRLAAEEEMEGMHIVRVPARKAAWERHTVPEMLSFLSAARQRIPSLLDSFQPDHVMAHFTYPAGALARDIGRRYGIPYSVVLHGSDVPGYQSGRFGFIYPLYAHFAKRVWRDAAQVIAVSDPLRELALQTWKGGDICVIDNGVDTSLFKPANHQQVDDVFRIVVTAQLIPRKGIQHLIPALAKLDAKRRASVRLDVYGVGPYRDELERVAEQVGLSDSVTFHGLIDHDKMPGLLEQADLFALPSLQEGLPLALLEAAAAGLPIMATRVGGASEVLVDRESAMLVEPQDVDAMSRAIADLMEDGDLRERLSSGARAVALQHAWDRVWHRYSEVIEREVRT